jgi:hypothetical protein
MAKSPGLVVTSAAGLVAFDELLAAAMPIERSFEFH